MIVAIVGSRTWTNYELMQKTLNKYPIHTIISGGAEGADTLAQRYAREKALTITIHYPDWRTHGRKAGMIRNVEIVNNSEMVIAFWDGISRGTMHTVRMARKEGKEAIVITEHPVRSSDKEGWDIIKESAGE